MRSMALLDVVPGPPFVPFTPDPAMLREAKKYIGGLPGCIKYMTPVPWVFDLAIDVMKPPVFSTPLPLLELIGWTTSFENSCRHCYGAQRAILRILGYDDAWMERVERDADLAEVDAERRPVVDLTRKLARSNPRPARAERDALTARYGAAVVAEIAFVITGWCFATRVSTFLRLGPDPDIERVSQTWVAWLLRPLFRRGLKKRARQPERVPTGGPFQPILDGMGDVPAASLMRRVIDRAFASPHIPRRAKLLVFAVVARSIPCGATEAEATRLLIEDGLAPDDVEVILKHLDSPKLDPLERVLVGFARASVRYDFLEIQDRVGRDLKPALPGTEQLLEAVGIAALANSVVRLAMLSA
jgi:alkylhydroperoxidase family enzyme